VDPLRGNYQEDTESRRYRGDHQHQTGQTWFEPQPDEDYRYPERRPAGRAPYAGAPGPIGQVPPGTEHRQHAPTEIPQQPPHWDPNLAPAPQWDTGMTPVTPPPTRESRRSRNSPASASPSAGARIGRSAVALILTVVVILSLVPVARVLLSGAFGPTRSTGAVVAGVLLLLGLPLGAVGLHGLTSETAKGSDPVASWLRPPVAYLIVALVMFLAAGLAARGSI
jgi:hypothetical protein